MNAKQLITSAVLTTLMLSVSSMAFAQNVDVLSGSKTVAVNSKKSNIKIVSEAPSEKIEGTVESGISGSFTMNMDNVAETTGSIALPVKEINTGNKLRDKHMRGKDWLNAKKNPNITFTIESLKDVKMSEKEGKKQSFKGLAVGKVNINGTDAPAQANVTVTALEGGKVKIAIDKFTVKLEDHKIAGKKGTIGNKVGETIEITGLVYGAAK
jgi:hypothetical protein